METLLGALLIFVLRIIDVSIGTVRTMFTVRGYRLVAGLLGVVESGVFIFAISHVLREAGGSPLTMMGYAFGFAAGVVLGITIEKWIASGTILIRCISPRHAVRLRANLLNEGFGVTSVRGEGRDGEVVILFIVAPRRKRNAAIAAIHEVDPTAFVTVEPVATAIGGHMPFHPSAAAFKK
ncbi:MAG TPA: DUF5698 domain-containing protein [Tepidisphaeraceae bacterium]|nr:DUF5698 domain-containing protein [Tepidisphaeraceae bacterium]